MSETPVIDCARLDEAETLQALDRACQDWGIFHVVNHGVAPEITNGLLRAMIAFFGQPTATKLAISRTATNPWGYYDRELTKNTRDWKEIWDYGPPDDSGMAPQWPPDQPGLQAADSRAADFRAADFRAADFRAAVLDFYGACETLAMRLVGAIADALGVDRGPMTGAMHPRDTSFLRLNHYPVCRTPERPEAIATPASGHLGVNHHTDAGVLTVLLQDERPGLEVYRRGAWRLVESLAGALTVNLGDVLQVWSNDRYVAPLHRVLASDAFERYSAPFFLNPDYRTVYAPFAALVDAAHPPRYRPIHWGEFRAGRAAGDYADAGEEIQISHYAIR